MQDPGRFQFYIIAGEPSGDRLGSALINSLKDVTDVEFNGIGGVSMTRAGLRSLFDMTELSVMGLTEVLPKLPNLIRRIRQTADDVIARRPDALITIDSPDFTLRVAARARKILPNLKVIHYVAPSVWAWRPGRAKKMARHVDHVLALLPFEPPYMHAVGMTCDFVGHPVAARLVPSSLEISAWRAKRGLVPGQPTVLLALGSRKGEVGRLSEPFLKTLADIRARSLPNLAVICPLAETVADDVQPLLKSSHPGTVFVSPGADDAEKHLAFASADAALCASGTITLELAAAGTPMVAAYKTTWLTAAIARRLLQINSANLVNLITERTVVPEFLQEFCTTDALIDALQPLLSDDPARSGQRAAFDEVMTALGRGGPPPEQRAAASVLRFLKGESDLPHKNGKSPGVAPPGPHESHIGKR